MKRNLYSPIFASVFGALALGTFHGVARAQQDQRVKGVQEPQGNAEMEVVADEGRSKAVRSKVESWTPSAAFSGGVLVYSVAINTSFGPIYVTVARRVDAKVPPGLYMVRGMGSARDLELSPDKRVILFKSGQLDEVNSKIYLSLWKWQTKSKAVLRGPTPGSAFHDVYWSRDNRYIGFNSPEFQGGEGGGQFGYTFCVYDTWTQRTYNIGKTGNARTAAWTNRGTILMSGSKEEVRVPKQSEQLKKDDFGYSNIYERATNGGESKLFLRNASAPMAESPDGKWIAFRGYGPALAEALPATSPAAAVVKPVQSARQALESQVGGFYLYNTKDKKRYRCNYDSESLSANQMEFMRWTPNSKNLIINRGNEFYKIDSDTHACSKLIELPQAAPDDTLTRNDLPPVEMLGFSQNGSYLVIRYAPYSEWAELRAISLIDGSTSTLTRIKDAGGMAWINSEDAKNTIIPTTLIAPATKPASTPKAKSVKKATTPAPHAPAHRRIKR